MSDRLTIEKKAELTAFWQDVAHAIGGGWVLDRDRMESYMPEGENWYHFEAILTNGTFELHARNNFYGNPGMWHCFPIFLKDHAGRTNTPYGKMLNPRAINISETKTSSQVAGEITRRALKQWQEFAGFVIELNAQVDSSYDLRRSTCEEIAQTFGLRVQFSPSSEREPYVYLDDRWDSIMKLEPGGEGKFYFKVSGANVEQVKQILTILRKEV